MDLTLTRAQIDDFLHHCHPIPAGKGLLTAWMRENANGMPSDRLMQMLQEAHAVEPSDTHVSGWQTARSITQVHLNDIP